MKVTHEDRKHASQFMTLIIRQAYGGNMLVAEHALAKLLADQRERCAMKLEEGGLPEAADWLRGPKDEQLEMETKDV